MVAGETHYSEASQPPARTQHSGYKSDANRSGSDSPAIQQSPFRPENRVNWSTLTGARSFTDGASEVASSNFINMTYDLPGYPNRGEERISRSQAGDPDGKKLEAIGDDVYNGKLGRLQSAVRDAQNSEQGKTFIKYVAQKMDWTKNFHAKYVDNPQRDGYLSIKLDMKGEQPGQTLKIGSDGSMELDNRPVNYEPDATGHTKDQKLDSFLDRLEALGNPPKLPDSFPKLSPQMNDKIDDLQGALNGGKTKPLQDVLAQIADLRNSGKPGDEQQAKELQDMLTVLGGELTTSARDTGRGTETPTFAIYDAAENRFRIGVTSDVPNQAWELQLKGDSIKFHQVEPDGADTSRFVSPDEVQRRMRQFNREYRQWDNRDRG